MTYTFEMYLVDKYMKGGDAKMPTPEYLRNLADEREKAGDESTAESLRNEADELEKASASTEATPQ